MVLEVKVCHSTKTNSIWYSILPSESGVYAFLTGEGTGTYPYLDTLVAVYAATNGCQSPLTPDSSQNRPTPDSDSKALHETSLRDLLSTPSTPQYWEGVNLRSMKPKILDN